ncbi:copper resistance CopC family protein [Cryobacterium tagatosivorans]|uniref:Copper resistance protein CopC n=1 Tax=Cryobacterium tagatosivorans TaxID=1259199 RepID=A0A4R8UGU4_9MICO|nr:copper resistance CopC family protein [Cryobacterium tagatosivorans]TFB51769.1 copper resistance protein CopC [Cryobacterium tagatosivorans]
MHQTSSAGRLARTLFATGVVAAAVGWSATPALAHNAPLPDGYVPADGAVVTTQPEAFRVTTSDALLDGATAGIQSRMLISGPAGAPEPLYYGDGCVSIVGPAIETTAELGEPGEYTVDWQAVSVDGHPISEKYSFTWQPADGQPRAEGSTEKPDCGGTVSYGSGTPQTDDAGAADRADASLADVLWIGGALGAVVLAASVTILVVTRRKPPALTDPAP